MGDGVRGQPRGEKPGGRAGKPPLSSAPRNRGDRGPRGENPGGGGRCSGERWSGVWSGEARGPGGPGWQAGERPGGPG